MATNRHYASRTHISKSAPKEYTLGDVDPPLVLALSYDACAKHRAGIFLPRSYEHTEMTAEFLRHFAAAILADREWGLTIAQSTSPEVIKEFRALVEVNAELLRSL